jgi:hypothetical protein
METLEPGKFILMASLELNQEKRLDFPTFIFPTMAIPE